MISFVASDTILTIFFDNTIYQFNTDAENYSEVVHLLNNYEDLSEEEIRDILTGLSQPEGIVNSINSVAANTAYYSEDDDQIYYNGKPIHSYLVSEIVRAKKSGLPIDNMLRFLENLEQNPSSRSRDRLFLFLQHGNLPITEDGCFLGYKSIQKNWTDWHTGKIDNHIGEIPKMDRRDVDDDFTNDCSDGYHVGTISYVNNFHGDAGRKIIVKVNPKDVVTVPDYDTTKLRCCEYEVISEYQDTYKAPIAQYNNESNSYDDFDVDDDQYYDDELDDFYDNNIL